MADGLNPIRTSAGKAKHQESVVRCHRRVRREILEHLGGKCAKCGFDDWRALQVDHVNGDGHADAARRGGSYAFAAKIVSNPSNYQLLCANCNWIKRYENKETR